MSIPDTITELIRNGNIATPGQGEVREVKGGPDQRVDATDPVELAMPEGPSGLSWGSRGCSDPCPLLLCCDTKRGYFTPRHSLSALRQDSFGV